jgi:hypothetical protein
MLRNGTKYSGENSDRFWSRIAAIKAEPAHLLIYLAGVALQEHEQRVLQMLEELEK